MKERTNIAMIEMVAKALGSLKKKTVFVGGAAVVLYLKDRGHAFVRPTDDVDCIMEITSRQDYHALQAKLEKIGFKHSMEENVPICRMDFKGLKVDIMPSDPRILGFSNKWYQEGMSHALETKLPNGDKIQIFPLPYFIASKMEAYFGRGKGDYRLSPDMEDIITLLGDQKDFGALLDAPEKVRSYLKNHFQAFVSDPLFIESITAHLKPGPKQEAKAEKILDQINAFCLRG